MNPLGYFVMALVRIITGLGRMQHVRYRRDLQRIAETSSDQNERRKARELLEADTRSQTLQWGILLTFVPIALLVVLIWPIIFPLIGIWLIVKLIGLILHL